MLTVLAKVTTYILFVKHFSWLETLSVRWLPVFKSRPASGCLDTAVNVV